MKLSALALCAVLALALLACEASANGYGRSFAQPAFASPACGVGYAGGSCGAASFGFARGADCYAPPVQQFAAPVYQQPAQFAAPAVYQQQSFSYRQSYAQQAFAAPVYAQPAFAAPVYGRSFGVRRTFAAAPVLQVNVGRGGFFRQRTVIRTRGVGY